MKRINDTRVLELATSSRITTGRWPPCCWRRSTSSSQGIDWGWMSIVAPRLSMIWESRRNRVWLRQQCSRFRYASVGSARSTSRTTHPTLRFGSVAMALQRQPTTQEPPAPQAFGHPGQQQDSHWTRKTDATQPGAPGASKVILDSITTDLEMNEFEGYYIRRPAGSISRLGRTTRSRSRHENYCCGTSPTGSQ